MIVWIEAVGCTNGCRHCPLGSCLSHETFYSARELQRLAETWGPLAPLEDPSVHPEFPEVLDRSITSPGMTYLGTNGLGIAQAGDPEGLFDRLRACGYEGLNFAVHGLDYWHDWLVGREGAFQDVLQATRRAAAAGFYVHWSVYLNRHNLEDIVPLAELRRQILGGSPYISLLNHRTHPYLQWYETIRPSLQQVREQIPDDMIADRWGDSLAALTEASWLREWEKRSNEEAFRHPFEPTAWPLESPFDNRCISITRDHQVYFNPLCAPPMLLGELSEDHSSLIERLQQLSEPYPDLRESWPRHLRDEDGDLLHTFGYSVRYKAISAALRSEDSSFDGAGGLDFCGHF